MKKITFTFTLGLLMLVSAMSATAAVVDPDARLRSLNEALYPDTITWTDWLCDGTADPIALPGN